VTEAIAEIVDPAARVSITGVWPPQDAGAVDAAAAEGQLRVPWSKLFNKNASIHMGRDDDERWNRKLREMIVSGAAKPSRVVSHRIPLEEAPNAFEKFDARQDGYIKVVLKL